MSRPKGSPSAAENVPLESRRIQKNLVESYLRQRSILAVVLVGVYLQNTVCVPLISVMYIHMSTPNSSPKLIPAFGCAMLRFSPSNMCPLYNRFGSRKVVAPVELRSPKKSLVVEPA